MGYRRSGIRWREDGWELRCDSCAALGRTTSYWPLTDEFWNRKASMARCRACTKIAKNRRDRERYARDMAFRAKRAEYARRYRAEAGEGITVKRRHRASEDAKLALLAYWRDPEAARAAARDRYHRNRDAILAKRRAAYAERAA